MVARKKMKPEDFREIRLKLGLSHEALAKVMGLGPHGRKTISLIENGHNKRGVEPRTAALMIAYRDDYRPKVRGKRVKFPCDEPKVEA